MEWFAGLVDSTRLLLAHEFLQDQTELCQAIRPQTAKLRQPIGVHRHQPVQATSKSGPFLSARRMVSDRLQWWHI
jgi:hypothetical protein